ncbi:MAG: gephyrin-like molybdotransferase Glp [Chloroflexota bacterium]
MRSVDEALDAILSGVRPSGVETLSLDRCVGRVLATFRITAAVDVPPFDNSSMDGFALRAANAPGRLRLAGEIVAGSAVLPRVEAGAAVRIMTGAPMPPGADSVAPLEVADEADGAISVPPVELGAHVRRAGHDTRAGELVELPAEPIGPPTLAVLASLGIGQVEVRRRPRVAIMSTGDELRAPGEALEPGQIHDANSAALAAAVDQAGGQALRLPLTPDDPGQIEQQVRAAVAVADLLVVSGGVSVGRHDHVRGVIERLGTLDFWRIRVQPGKPLAYGAVDDMPVIGLPGNPVSALVTYELFARPLIRRMLGLTGSGRLTLPAVARDRMTKDPERRAYLRVRVERGAGGLEAHSAGGQASSQLRSLASANALLVVAEGEPAAEPGGTYDALLLGEIG